jgi:pimeloyl-ACP methyl ester carboxylesterase
MLALEKSGNGVPLVFLHAFPLSRKMWDAHKPIFAKNFQFISVDFPGFGESPSIGDTLHMDSMADELNKALDANGIKDKIVLCGVSMGGYAAFRFLARYPKRLRALALVATKATPDPELTKQKRAENIALIEKEGLVPFAERMVQSLLGKTVQASHPEVVEAVRKSILEQNPKSVIAGLRGLAARPDSSGLLAGIDVPTFVLSGEEDTVIPTADMKSMAGQLKKCDFQSLPGCGHLLPIEKPADFQNAFLTYLKRRVL